VAEEEARPTRPSVQDRHRAGHLHCLMTKEDLQRLRAVFEGYGEVAGVWLLGSHARGAASARSDLDLAIDPAAAAGSGARARKLDMLADLVGAGFENVDLVILDGDDPVLRFEAIGPNVLVDAAPGYDPAEAFVQALRQYDDTAPLRARCRTAYYERLLRHDG
jgi:uncharacterized protein